MQTAYNIITESPFVSFVFVLGATFGVLRDCSLFCSQESLLEVLRRSFAVQKIESGLDVCKASAPSSVLLF